MNTRSSAFALFLGLIAVAPAAYAQDVNDTGRTTRPVDEALERALNEEYESPAPSMEEIDTSPPVVIMHDHEPTRDWARLSLSVALYVAEMHEAEIRHSVFSNDRLDFSKLKGVKEIHDDDENPDLDWAFLKTLSVGINRYISITGSFHQIEFKGTKILPTNFFYADDSFQANSNVRAGFKFTQAELGVDVRPINNDWFRLDLNAGLRYLRAEIELDDFNGNQQSDRHEGLAPYIGGGVAVKFFNVFEIYGNLKVGGFSYEERDRRKYRKRDDETDEEARERRRRYRENRDERSYSFATLDIGAQLKFFDRIAIRYGVRVEAYSIGKKENGVITELEGSYGGPYAALVLIF